MARPIKKGIDYFSFDVDFFEDTRIKKLRSKYKTLGIVTYIFLLTKIYKEQGYYIFIDDDQIFDIADSIREDAEVIKEIIDYMATLNLLIKKEISKSIYCLTSERIQKTYQASVKARGKKSPVKINGKIWILLKEDTEDYIEII
ncbi:MAG: DUF4373 domain-containing protein [Clostridia bacterium]|nr:DUF4373 domain-containing protein [Clostridia bacterium]